jgi:hypothetical protein
MTTFGKKLQISLISASLFAVVNLPQVYKITNNLIPLNLYNNATSCPTNIGLIIHAIVFFVLTFLTMSNAKLDTGIKLKHTIYGTLIFYLLSSPALFSLVGSIMGKQIADVNGCPTMTGLMTHAVAYCGILIGVMYLPNGK